MTTSPSNQVITPTLVCLKCMGLTFNILLMPEMVTVLRCTGCGQTVTLPDKQGNCNVIGSFTEGEMKTDA